MTVINAAPYAGGMLAKGSDRVKRITSREVDDAALAPVRPIEAACARQGTEPGAVALRFSMRQLLIGTTVVGVSRPERVRKTLGRTTEATDTALWEALDGLPFDTVDPGAERIHVPG